MCIYLGAGWWDPKRAKSKKATNNTYTCIQCNNEQPMAIWEGLFSSLCFSKDILHTLCTLLKKVISPGMNESFQMNLTITGKKAKILERHSSLKHTYIRNQNINISTTTII